MPTITPGSTPYCAATARNVARFCPNAPRPLAMRWSDSRVAR